MDDLDELEKETLLRNFYLQRFVNSRWFAGAIMLPLMTVVMLVPSLYGRGKMREAAVEICAQPPECPGDEMEISTVAGKNPGYKEFRGLVLYRRSSDCSREVEVHFSDSGSFAFRGSVDDPDVSARVEFIERRKQYGKSWVGPRLPCERAGELRSSNWFTRTRTDYLDPEP